MSHSLPSAVQTASASRTAASLRAAPASRGRRFLVDARRRRAVHWLLLACVSVAGGCVRELMRTPNVCVRQQEIWSAVPPNAETTAVEVIYITDRARVPRKDKVVEYGSARSQALAFGTCTVRLGDKLTWTDLLQRSTEAVRKRAVPLKFEPPYEVGRFPPTPLPVGPDANVRALFLPSAMSEVLLATVQLQALVQARLKHCHRKRALIYVHGFNNTFFDTIQVSAELWHFAGRDGVPITYTWPSQGGASLFSYNYDRESSEFTVLHFKETLERLAEIPELERIDILAHSRGCEVVFESLRELNIKYRAQHIEPAVALKLGNVMLAAPDVDLDVMMQRFIGERASRAARRFTVYSSRTDLAIAISAWLFRSTVRLGTLGLADLPPPERELLSSIPDLHWVNAEVATDLIGHTYFYSNPAVSSDIIRLLQNDCDPGTDCRPLQRRGDGSWELRDTYLLPRDP
jgi:esterase/lipase superfamily enzyme